MTEKTPYYRNLVLERSQAEGCPGEVTKEAIAHTERAIGDTLTEAEAEVALYASAYAYTAGRVARWDALVKGSPRLLDAILRQVHEFFHDEPFGQHDGTAGECTDCPTVAALAADAAAAFYTGELTDPSCPDSPTPDVYAEDVEDDFDDVEIERLSDLAEQGYDETQLLPHVPARALHTDVPGEWRAVAPPTQVYDSTDPA